jgi:general secretion pathway protein G
MKNASQGHSSHSAFTMIELMFVIVILGILSAIALPKFAATKNLADVAKGRSDVMAIRSAILSERQSQLIKGINTYIPKLSDNNNTLFTGDGTRKLLNYGITSATTDGHWSVSDGTGKNYNYKVESVNVPFTYNSTTGIFTCTANQTGTAAQKYCYKMIN